MRPREAPVSRLVPRVQAEAPLKLNLGAGPHRLEGFDNLDKGTGWLAEAGLPYRDESVEAVTVSHLLQYIHARAWMQVFLEIHRALVPGGVVRITETDCLNPGSDCFLALTWSWVNDQDWITLTHPSVVEAFMARAGFQVARVQPHETYYTDGSLIQAWHGHPPRVFHVEGIKPI